MSITIRRIEPRDRPALEEVLRSDTTFTADEIGVALELIDDRLDNAGSDYWFLVADAGEPLAGYICYGPTPMTEGTFDLYWIVSHASFRGRGVARGLIEAMEADLAERRATAIRVETSVKESHEAARKLYARLGYPEAARFEDFYAPGDDLLVYYKRLRP